MFESFFNVDVKVALDRQPLLGTSPLPDWLRNLARGRAGPMVSLALHCCSLRSLLHRSSQAARELLKGFFKLTTAPNDCPKTSLDELDNVERHLNQGTPVSDWLGVRVYEPERGGDGEVIRHFRRNLSEPIKHVIAIGVYDGHAFLMPSKGVRMCSLPSPFHTSMQPSKAHQNMRARKNRNQMLKRKSRSPTDSL